MKKEKVRGKSKNMKARNLRSNKAITLIALVITIIILLILAGVSIATLTGDNGLLTKAQEATEQTEVAEVKDRAQLDILNWQADQLKDNNDATLNDDIVKGILNGKDYISGFNVEDPANIKVKTKNGYEFPISDLYDKEGEDEPIDNSGSLVLGFADDLGTRSTIYLYGNSNQITSGEITITMPDNSTQTVTAVSDNTEISDESNYATYTVTKNGTYTFSVTNGSTTTETKIKVSNIETFMPIEEIATEELSENAYSYKGAAVPKGYYVDTKSSVDTGLVITDEIDSEGYATGNEWVWVPVNSTAGNNDYYIEESGTFYGAPVTYNKYSKLYSFSQARTRDEYGTFYPYGNSRTGSLTNPSQNSGYREPYLLTDSKYGERTYYSSINKRGTASQCADITEVATQYKDDYENMIDGVNTYGGFYIGRYEITANGEKAGDSLTGLNWYALYNECMKFDDETVTSGMMYGTLWDATMQWLSSKYDVGYTGNDIIGFGNCNRDAVTVGDTDTKIIVKPSRTSRKLKTGQTSYTKTNNIYDLSGNYYDWTQEAKDDRARVSRGGDDNDDSRNNYPHSSGRYGSFVPTVTGGSSRAHFYIK